MAKASQLSAFVAQIQRRTNIYRQCRCLVSRAWRQSGMDLIMADNARSLSADNGRDQRGRFAAGRGNIGRPVGAKNKVSRDLLAQIKAMGPAAVVKLWEALQNNERWAVEIILSHTLPADRTLEFEGVTPTDVEAALAAGDISPNEAKAIATTIEKLRTIEDLDQIRAKLIELEAIVTDGKN